MSDWYFIDNEIFPVSLLKRWGSLDKVLNHLFPDHFWESWKFHLSFGGWWKFYQNQRRFLDWLMEEHRFSVPFELHYLNIFHLRKMKGKHLILRYRTIQTIVISIYPEINFQVWLFREKHRTENKFFWNKDDGNFKQNDCIKSLDAIASELSLCNLEDWYEISPQQALCVDRKNAFTLLSQFQYSLTDAILTCYPSHEWKIHRFPTSSFSMWSEKKSHLRFLDSLGMQLGYQISEDWYLLNPRSFSKYGGNALLCRYYSTSHVQVVIQNLPEFEWNEFKLQTYALWVEKDLNSSFIYLERRLGINSLNDWYRTSREQMVKNGGGILLSRYQSKENLLRRFYPFHDWSSFSSYDQDCSKKSTQRWLLQSLSSTFPRELGWEEEVSFLLEESEKKKTSFEIDIYCKNVAIAFEYQGVQHFENVKHFSKYSLYKFRDNMKKKWCSAMGISLISIDWEWDRTTSQLASLIQNLRGDLQQISSPQ